MDANRYFDAMHNAMSAQHPGAQLLLTVKLQDTCGNDACLELKQLPGESTSILCYSTMGRRCLNFQLFRKGWQLCHNADGQLVGRFPSSADGLIDETDFRAYCREDRLDLARTQRITAELRQCAGINYQGSIPQNARTGAVITVESFVGAGARWTYWSQDVLPSLPLAPAQEPINTDDVMNWPVPSAAPCRPTRRQPALPPSGWPVIQPYSSIRRCR